MKQMNEKESLSLRLLQNCRNELYSLFPFLDGAFASLPYMGCKDTQTMGTDGEKLLFCSRYLIGTYGTDPGILRRCYLHILLHCLYLHPFRRQEGDRRLWNLACDMAVEQILERENQSRLARPQNPVFCRCLQILGDTPLPAEKIMEMLTCDMFPDPLPQMEAAFLMDDHHLWERVSHMGEETWRHVLAYTSQNRRGGGQAGNQGGKQKEKFKDIQGSTQNYGKYLRKFAVFREEMELDMDSFDYIYYNLGMMRYGNLPLIEPLETREGHKLSQLVIAIDTSGSCQKETVREFLSQTYSILSNQENFFRKMEVYLIQCDCMVQSVAVIRNRQQWQNYSREIMIAGRGGTDFTPVFRYVEDLQSQGKLRDLKALLYFTDGDGCYPREKPPYETAFVFEKPNCFLKDVPAWAKKMLISDS